METNFRHEHDTVNAQFEKDITGLIVIDPYNDFISENGKIWDRIKSVAEANNCVPNMLSVLNAARNAGLRIFTPCIIVIVPVIMKPGNTWRRSRRTH